jgi:hypothetical protein
MPFSAKKFLIALIPGSFLLGLAGCDLLRAPDSGTWYGTAVYRDDLSAPVNCRMELDVRHDDETLRVLKLENTCDNFRSTWESLTFDIHGNELWRDGRAVGHANPSGSVTFDLPDPNYYDGYPFPANRVVVTWSMVSGALEFSEDVYYQNRVQTTHAWLNARSSYSGSISWDGDVAGN